MRPRIIWQAGNYRLVISGQGDLTPEKLTTQDALGNDVWLRHPWEAEWGERCVTYLLERITADERRERAGSAD